MQLVILALPGNTPETPMITLEYHTPRLRQGPRYYDANLGNRAIGRLLLTSRLQPPNPLATLVAPALLFCHAHWSRLMMKHCHLIACHERGRMDYGLPSDIHRYDDSFPRLRVCHCDANTVTLSVFIHGGRWQEM